MPVAAKIDRTTPQGVASLWRQRVSKELSAGSPVQMVVSEPVDGFLPSLSVSGRVIVEGTLGDYALANFAGGDAEIRGGVGYAAACGMHSGNLQIDGAAGDMLAAHCRGGSVLIRGSSGGDCGAGMAEGDICVVGDVGAGCGRSMTGGVIVVFGNAAPGLGAGMTGGAIYIRGFANQVDSRISETRMRESDRLRLSLILLRVNVEASPRDFRTYRCVAAGGVDRVSVGPTEDPHRLFADAPASLPRLLPRLLYRLPRGANGHRIRTAAALRSFGCWTMMPGNRNSSNFDTAEETVAEMADDARCRFGSFGWDEWPDDADSRTAFAEWRVIGGEGVFDGSHSLAKMGMRLPIDVASPRRLRQRLSLLKDSLPHSARVGLAVNLESAEANADVLAELPIEFLTIICPGSAPLDQHPATALVDRSAEPAIRRYRGRGGPRIICQPPLRSGYDVAYYFAVGADAVVVNGLPMFRAGGLRVEQGPRLFDVTVDFIAGKDELRPAAGPIERFIAEVADGARYYGIEL